MANMILNMHYDYKLKLNKVDSHNYVDMKIPEIDWKLNEAMNLLIDMIAFPRMFEGSGFELDQRSIDDLRPIVVDRFAISTIELDRGRFLAPLPANYLHHLSSYVNATKGTCNAKIRTTIIQHDDENEESVFDKSSFEWREVNIRFASQGIIIFTDGDFSISNMLLDYLRKPAYIHAAGDFVNGEYELPDGTLLSGYQNCELPVSLHSKIVDLAVLITTGDFLDNYEIKRAKLQITN